MLGSDTVVIPLTKGYSALIDADDYGVVSQYSWCVDERPNGLCYANTTIGRRTVRMHELLLPEAAPEIDHRNNDGLDNRRENLRPATRSQNAANIRPMKGRRYKGVTYQPRLTTRPWQARAGVQHLGYFATEEEAAAAYDKYVKEHRGEFSRINNVTTLIKPNFLFPVVKKEIKMNPNGRGRLLEYTLSCGHSHSVRAFQAPKIGPMSHCKTCKKGSA